MAGSPQRRMPLRQSQTSRAKVKSGCRTCKIRKVKCDEGRPACHRCVATGRVCDGYGIWGGGGNAYGHQSVWVTDCNRTLLFHSVPNAVSALKPDEQGCFEWFICRSAAKLPGAFASSFWDTLLPQAGSGEPAVLHAILALTSAHKSEFLNDTPSGKRGSIPDQQELFTLQQYSKAIRHLQPHFSIKDKASLRVALITCVVFICMEFLRRHYRTGIAYLKNGLKLLEAIQTQSSMVDNVSFILKPSQNVIDDWIIEAFIRLHVQARLFGQSSQNLYLAPRALKSEVLTTTLLPINEARQHLDRLLNSIPHLTEQCCQEGMSENSVHSAGLLDSQQMIQAEISSWLRAYRASMARLQTQITARDAFAYRLLRVYYTMAGIMANTCLRPTCESVFDSHINEFTSMITQSIDLWNIRSSNSLLNTSSEHGAETPQSIADIGWIPPLYYTAIKCRIHRVRLQAIKLLESISHKEGIWDATLAACIAREVMRIEEGEFYKDVYIADDFPLYSAPEEWDLLLPTLPNSYRMHETQVTLPNESLGKLILVCRRRGENAPKEVFVREYDMLSQCWRDRTHFESE